MSICNFINFLNLSICLKVSELFKTIKIITTLIMKIHILKALLFINKMI